MKWFCFNWVINFFINYLLPGRLHEIRSLIYLMLFPTSSSDLTWRCSVGIWWMDAGVVRRLDGSWGHEDRGVGYCGHLDAGWSNKLEEITWEPRGDESLNDATLQWLSYNGIQTKSLPSFRRHKRAVLSSRGSEARLPGLESKPCNLLPLWTESRPLALLSLSFLIQ